MDFRYLITLVSICLTTFYYGQNQVNLHFINAANGYALRPQLVEITNKADSDVSYQITKEQITHNGSYSFNIPDGEYHFLVQADGYGTMTSSSEIKNQTLHLTFNMEPMDVPKLLNTSYIRSFHTANSVVIAGCITDEKTGIPLNNVIIKTKDNVIKTKSNDEGYFQLLLPLPTTPEEIPDRSILIVEKNGYDIKQYKNFDLFPNGDLILQVKLKTGSSISDENVIKNRTAEYILKQEHSENFSEEENKILSPTSSSCVNSIRVGSTCSPCATGCSVVNVVAFETYVKRSLAAEWYNCWGSLAGGMNSLQAGAVAIRTYARWRIDNPLTSTYDICDNACCQGYSTTQYTNSDNAVINTTNYVLLNSSGNIVKSEYASEQNNHPSCGNGSKGDGSATWPCTTDPVCSGKTYNGHGRGLCQFGSARWATGNVLSTCGLTSSHGYGTKTWQQILSWYYPSWTLTQCIIPCPLISAPTTSLGSSNCPGTSVTIPTSLSWTSVSGAQGYRIAVSKYPYGGTNALTLTNSSCITTTAYTASPALQAGMLYRWNVTGNSSSICSSSSCEGGTSSTLYFHIPPKIVANSATTFCQGNSITLSVSPVPTPGSGTSMVFQWYKNGTPIGTNSSTHSTNQSGNYTVKIAYSGSTLCVGTATTNASNTISVTVQSIPIVTNITGVSSPCLNSSQNYSATVTSTGYYLWTYPVGWTINSGQGTSIINTNVQSNGGLICVTPSNTCGNGTQFCTPVSINTTTINSTVSVNAPTLTAMANPASYQWINCANMQPIASAINQSYIPTVNGTYAVEVTQNTCISTSPCYAVVAAGITDLHAIYNFVIYPNPTTGILNIKGNTISNSVFKLMVRNMLGQSLLEKDITPLNNSFETQFNMSELAAGMYFLVADTKDNTQVYKIQKQ